MKVVRSDQNKTATSSNSYNNNQPFFPGKNSSFHQAAKEQPEPFFKPSTVIQKKEDEDQGDPLSFAEAKDIILKATHWPGTRESKIYDAIERCNNHKALMYDQEIINALKGDMGGHELWKCYLLMEYGKKSNYPSPINELWNATKGGGTDDTKVLKSLNDMDRRAKTSLGLEDILHSELSGDTLQQALDLITVSDSIKGNLYGDAEGGEKLGVNEDNLKELIDSRFAGASSSSLRNAMEILYQNPEGEQLKSALTQIESIRGLAPGSGLTQYKKAMSKQKAGVEYYKKKKKKKNQDYNHAIDNPSPPLDIKTHKSFTASSAQLRFGKILGDVFGIDAVFGSLISPTGGIPGAGNNRIGGLENGGAVVTHGAIHDAAGYLYNSHGIGPGYDYLDTEPGADPSNPLAGQTNVKWWIEEFDNTDNAVGAFERLLNQTAYIGAAFSKIYSELNTEQKKEVLKVMSSTITFALKKVELSDTDRINEIGKLMKSCNDGEKTELANYFYENDTFGTVLKEILVIMKPHVLPEVYKGYTRRMYMRSAR